MQFPDRKSLSVQLVLSLVGLALLTALIVGAPAIWLIQRHLENQAWTQVEQGAQVARALYAAKEQDLGNLATLTAQRPSLRSLLQQGDLVALDAYLETLRLGADLDWVAVCDEEGMLVTQVGGQANGTTPSRPCSLAGTQWTTQGTSGDLWLISEELIGADPGDIEGSVVVGQLIDAVFASRMRSQTGLEHTIFTGSRPAVTSLLGAPALARGTDRTDGSPPLRASFEWAGEPYFAQRFDLSSTPTRVPTVQVEIALPVAEVVSTEQRLVRVLLGSMVLASTVGFFLAVFLARRVSRPLGELANAAAAMSRGDLSQSLTTDSDIREVALVSMALNGARTDLQRILDELRGEKAWTDHLLGAIVEGIITLDRQGFITYFSQGAERITGLTSQEVLGRNCDQCFLTVDGDKPFSALIPSPGGRSKIALRLLDGRQAILAFTGARLLPPEGGDARVALVFRDISEEEVVHRLLGHFLANVSHEFRTPLSAVAAAVELLMDQAPVLSPGEIQELLTSLHLGVLNLQTLVDNLLESASIEAGRFQVHARPCTLQDSIAEAVRIMQPLLDKHGQRLIVELPASVPLVRADPRRTVQVLVNLLSNASKYGPVDAEIAVALILLPGWVQVSVSDQGPGIPAAQRGDLFQRFATSANGDSHTQVGFGLGLSVVKAIVEGHHGQVGVDDRPGGGSTFWFTLPIAEGRDERGMD